MLISSPFLSATSVIDNDDRVSSGEPLLGERAGTGAFPVSHQFGWHGGMHLVAPKMRDGTPESVHAIADGEVVFARPSDGKPAHDTDPAVMQAHPLLYYTGWTSNGVVILKHVTEMGENVSVTFYSIYQHMDTLTDAVVNGAKVWRKDALGTAGVIYGRPNEIHFEIVADCNQLNALIGRDHGPLTAAQGRTTSVWGDMHCLVPAGAAIYATDPRTITKLYTVRHFNPALNTTNDSVQSVAAMFDTTPAALRAMSRPIPSLDVASDSDSTWFNKRNGVYQLTYRMHEPTYTERTISVPALYGDQPMSPGMWPELWEACRAPLLTRTRAPLIVSLSEERETITLTVRDRQGTVLGRTTEDSYDLYARAVKAYPGCPSAGYELLRFGRVLGPDQPATSDLHAGRLPHFRAIRYIDGLGQTVAGYLDLNPSRVNVYSDADFPDWLGWTFIDDDAEGDSRCNSQQLLEVIDPRPDAAAMLANATPAANALLTDNLPDVLGQAVSAAVAVVTRKDKRERLRRACDSLNHAAIRKRLSYCVVTQPSEWSRANFDLRWAWLKGTDPAAKPAHILNPYCLSDDDYGKFKRHHSALAFWEEAKAAGLELDTTHVHLHPGRFIETFRKCGWLSESEFTQLLPTSIMREASHDQWVSDPVTLTGRRQATIQKNRIELNKSLRKYSIAPSPLRMAAFFGNATEETQWFGKLYEDNATAWYRPWDGRGFLQLTGPGNYIKYWRFRGRAISPALESELNTAAAKARGENKNDALQDGKHLGLTVQMITWRDQLLDATFIDASDSAGAYWAWTASAAFADQPPVMERETQVVGHDTFVYYSCESFGQVAATVNFGSPVKDIKKIAKVNGIVARYQAYANALMVLADRVVFLDAQDQSKTDPEEYVPRRP